MAENDEMGSLFEGMILFNTSQITDSQDQREQQQQSFPLYLHDHKHPPPPSSSSSSPLDENLFSDLTLVAPVHDDQTLIPIPPANPSFATTTSVATPEIPSGSSASRQISRKKKKPGFRIGYGRDASLLAEEPNSSFRPDSYSQSPTAFNSIPSKSEEKSGEQPIAAPVEPASPSSSPAIEIEVPEKGPVVTGSEIDVPETIQVVPGFEIEVEKDKTGGEEGDIRAGMVAEAALDSSNREEEGSHGIGGYNEKELKQIRDRISAKLDYFRGMVSEVSAARKEAARKRRKAAVNVNLASCKYKELEKELEEACEAEDFERAERVSENLAAVEKEKESLVNALRDAEAECDSADMKMQEVLKLQIAAEEEGVLMLEQFAKEAADTADLILKNAEEHSLKEIDEWSSSMEALEVKKMELEIKSHLINGARLELGDSIEHAIENDRKEKEILCQKRHKLTEELEKLLALVREKGAEIAENDSNILEVEGRIADVVSGFHDAQSSLNTNCENMKSVLSLVDLQSEALSTKKKEIDDFLSQEETRGGFLRELASTSMDEAKERQELVGLRKSLALPIFKYQEVKVRLVKTEENIQEEVQTLRQEVSTSRASLQELSSTRSRIQQEIASAKQRIFFIDKRSPELEAEKKVAAAARNFKEAGRVAAEAKSLGVEKESIQNKIDAATLELGKVEEEINSTVQRLQETEELISLKEREAAMAGFERLRLISAAAMAERSAALDLGDLEEANTLLAEAQAADLEATKLQEAYNLKENDFESGVKHLFSIELIANLGGKQLAEIATSMAPSPA